jgi:predicted Zn-dependent protease
MIDSTTDPPKEDRETVIEKLLKSIGLTLFLMACVADPPPAMLPNSSEVMTTSETRTTDTTDPRVETAATQSESPESQDEEGANESAPEGAVEQAAESDAEEAGAEEGAGADEDGSAKEGEKERRRPGRIVLKTVYDDKRVGDDQSQAIAAELGLVKNPALVEYVRSVGIRLLRHAPSRPFDYEFQIVDQSVPNAFALPGGKIYVSRGLLALVESEDELAGVLGHEITHAAERHSAARIDYAGRLNPFSIGYLRAGAIAAYSREQEGDADRGGQIMAARAGYDPAGIARFLRKLDASERYEVGWSRLPYFLATHPTSPQRSARASDRAAGISWERKRGLVEHLPLDYYQMIDGLILGENPEGGLFDEGRFVHPEMGFSIRFPKGWTTMNGQAAVSAISPARDAQATLTVEGTGTDIEKVVDEFIRNEVDGIRVRVRTRKRVKLGDLPAIRIEGSASTGLIGLAHQMTFVAHEGLIFRLSVVSYSSRDAKYRGRGRAFAHSFRALDEAGIYSLMVTRLRIARALPNETLQALSERTHNDLEVVFTGVMNDLYASTTLTKGALIKIGLDEPYLPNPKEETRDEEANEPEAEAEPDLEKVQDEERDATP